jgi:hypothetical protein
MCGSGEPEDAPELWERYKQDMNEDFIGCYSEETVLSLYSSRNQ